MGAVILVVDDERPVCRLIESILKAKGHCVYVAHTVEAAVELAQSLGPELDILICDVFLERGRSGIEVIRAIQPTCPNVVVIITSGDLEADNHAPFKLDGDHFLVLPKPFTMVDLMHVIDRALNQRE